MHIIILRIFLEPVNFMWIMWILRIDISFQAVQIPHQHEEGRDHALHLIWITFFISYILAFYFTILCRFPTGFLVISFSLGILLWITIFISVISSFYCLCTQVVSFLCLFCHTVLHFRTWNHSWMFANWGWGRYNIHNREWAVCQT